MAQIFWELQAEQREQIAQQRMYGGPRYVVWDYCPDKDGNYGIIEQCPKAIDRGFTHGFMFTDPKVCALHHDYVGVKYFSINVYHDYYPEDETFEHRTKNMWHIFTSREKAEAYAAKAKQLFPETLTLENILPEIQKVFGRAYITKGRRGYETNTPEYECITSDHGWTTFQITDEGRIRVQFGQNGKYIIPHKELIVPTFTNVERGHNVNYNYCVSEWAWNDFYKNK